MRAYYLDSSAWVKLYSLETGTPRIAKLFSGEAILGCSELGVIELTATFARKRKGGEIDPGLFAAFKSSMRRTWANFYQVLLDDETLKSAAYVAETYSLRGADSIHLASAMQMASSMMDQQIITIFVSSDLELNSAARQVGFEVLDPQAPQDA